MSITFEVLNILDKYAYSAKMSTPKASHHNSSAKLSGIWGLTLMIGFTSPNLRLWRKTIRRRGIVVCFCIIVLDAIFIMDFVYESYKGEFRTALAYV